MNYSLRGLYVGNLTFLLTALFLSGCQTPLEKAIKRIAPDYQAARPATNNAELGHRLIDGVPDANQCYISAPDTTPARSWEKIVLEYEGSVSGEVKTDFGKTITAEAGGSKNVNSTVTLEGLSESRLKREGLFMNPKAVCADRDEEIEKYKKGQTDFVIIRAVRADRVSVTSHDKNSAHLKVDSTITKGIPVNAQGSGQSSDKETWDGNDLYVSRYVRPVDTKLERIVGENISVPGSTGRIGACSFSLLGLTPTEWTGNLNCDGDNGKPTMLKATIHVANGVNTAPGVTYSVRVYPVPGGVGSADVELTKWTVLEKQ